MPCATVLPVATPTLGTEFTAISIQFRPLVLGGLLAICTRVRIEVSQEGHCPTKGQYGVAVLCVPNNLVLQCTACIE